ncbi:MAG: hypothetical protein KQA31_00145 [Candidatus Aenigmarchaeota archaeon]|nr:hypothetical protein [Candidatus Aenigmarchaeota archaeon]
MRLAIILILFILIGLLLTLTVKEKEIYLEPLYARDSDGSDSEDIINNMKENYEIVSLKANPFGYVELSKFQFKGFIKRIDAEFYWNIYEDFGGGNIYIGYSFDGKNYIEKGPFNESGSYKIDIPVNIFSNLNNLRLRFRGEDLDFGPDALAEVKMKLKVYFLAI